MVNHAYGKWGQRVYRLRDIFPQVSQGDFFCRGIAIPGLEMLKNNA